MDQRIQRPCDCAFCCVVSLVLCVSHFMIPRPPSLRPRRHTPRNTSPRRRAVDLQAPSPTPTRRTPRRAADRAPPRPHQPAHTLAHRRAPKITSHVVGLQTSPRFAPLHTPTRTEENFATRPPFDHSDARGGIPYRDAGLQTSHPRHLLPTPTRAE